MPSKGSTFRSVRAEVAGEMDRYAGWRELESKLAALVQTPHGPARRIAMEYSPQNAIPYVSLCRRRDEGTGRTRHRRRDRVQRRPGAVAQAVLDDAQIASHRRAAAVCLAAKDRLRLHPHAAGSR
jgi:Xaa-Pro dipeptidase